MGTVRFALALAVALFHNGVTALGPLSFLPGNLAVQAFFLISGFLITLILCGGRYDTARAGGLRLFYSNRLLRIFVPYAVVLALTLAAGAVIIAAGFPAPANLAPLIDHAAEFRWPTAVFVLWTNLGILGSEATLWLRYAGGALVLTSDYASSAPPVWTFIVNPPVWSVSLELAFYAIAPLMVRRPPVLVGILVVSTAARLVAYRVGLHFDPYVYRFFPFEISLFALGGLAWHGWDRLRQTRPAWLGLAPALAATALVVFIVIRWRFTPELLRSAYTLPLFAVIALCLPFLFEASRRLRADRLIGELSYPLYLVHWPILCAVQAVTGEANAFLSVALALVAAAALAVFVAAPLDAWRHARMRGLAPQPAGSPPAAG